MSIPAIPPSFGRIQFHHITRWRYLLLCFAFALLARAVVLAFIAASKIKQDPIRCPECKRERPNCKTCGEPKRSWKGRYVREWCLAYLYCWYGLSARQGRHYDLWLPFIIGFAELVMFPILMAYGAFTAIGGWLALRTAGALGVMEVGKDGLLSLSAGSHFESGDLLLLFSELCSGAPIIWPKTRLPALCTDSVIEIEYTARRFAFHFWIPRSKQQREFAKHTMALR